MNLFLLFIVILMLWGARIHRHGDNFEGYLDHDHTTRINGVFILIVFYAHIRSYMPFNPAWDGVMHHVATGLGQLMVALFLFYSGFGVAHSLAHKPGYVHTMPLKRVAVTWVNFAIAQVLFIIMNLSLSRPFTPAQTAWAFLGWKSIGSSSWYIFAILVLYVLTWLAFSIFRNSPWLAFILNCVLVGGFTVFMWHFKGNATYTYNTLCCYLLGMCYCLAREHFERVYRRTWGYVSALLITAALFVLTTKLDHLSFLVFELEAMLFCLLVVQITLFIHLNNPVLHWFGKHLFWVYVLQRLPMLALRELGMADAAPYVYALVCFAATVGLAWVMARLTAPLDAKLAAWSKTWAEYCTKREKREKEISPGKGECPAPEP